MALVTAIENQKRRNSRVSVYLDGEYALSLEKETCSRMGISVGDEICQEQVMLAAKEDERRAAFERALSYLERRAHTEKQVSSYLKGREFSDEVIEETLVKLREYRFVDDEAYAVSFAEEKMNVSGHGPYRIFRALREQGISDEIAGDVISRLDPKRQEALLSAQAERLLRRYSGLPEREAMGKASQALYRKGYGWDEIRFALEDAVLHTSMEGEEMSDL